MGIPDLVSVAVACADAAHTGYFRLWRKPYRGWYLHQAVADMLVKLWNPHGWKELPDGFEVHHLDWDRGNNDPSNLLILQEALHHAFQRASVRCPYTGRFQGRGPLMSDDEFEAFLDESLRKETAA